MPSILQVTVKSTSFYLQWTLEIETYKSDHYPEKFYAVKTHI